MLQSEIQEAKDDSCYLLQPLRRIRLKEKVNIQKLQYIVDISKLWLVKVRNREGNNKIELYLGRLNEKGEHIVTFTQKGGKRRYFADCPSLQGVIKKGETISKKKTTATTTTTTTIDIDTENVHPITGSFLQTEWYWNSNVELVHWKSWSESRWWSLYNSREIKHKKSFWLSLMEEGM